MRRDRKPLCNKGVMAKAGIPPSIDKEFIEFCERLTDLKWTDFLRKAILTKNDLKLRLKFIQKICLKHAVQL